MRFILKFLLFGICAFGVARFCKAQTGSFTIARMTSNLKPNPRWDVAPLPSQEQAEIKKILSQPYKFLGRGAQSYVFASEDGQYVIKFFRYHHLQAPLHLKLLPFEWAKRKAARKDFKLIKDFNSYKIAYEMLKEETALVYLHLNKTNDLNITMDLIDNLGIHYQIPLDQHEFLVQRKAVLFYDALDQMISENRIEDGKAALTNLVNLLVQRIQKGVYDKDPDINTNFGAIGTRAVEIDAGRFSLKPRKLWYKEIIRITDNLHQWLMVRCPELDAHLKAQVENL